MMDKRSNTVQCWAGLAALLLLVSATMGSACTAKASSWARTLDAIHTDARTAEAAGSMNEALKHYERAVALLPPDTVDPVKALALRQDAYFALGRARLSVAQPGEALKAARAGLALGGAPTSFVANLFALEATALEALGRDIDALVPYDKAMTIHEKLLDQALLQAESAPGRAR